MNPITSPIIDDMIRRSCWSPQNSGFRPLRNADEAKQLIGERILIFRGTTGYPNWVVEFRESDVLLRWRVGGKEWSDDITYLELFRWYKFRDNSYPIGLPGEQTPEELKATSK